MTFDEIAQKIIDTQIKGNERYPNTVKNNVNNYLDQLTYKNSNDKLSVEDKKLILDKIRNLIRSSQVITENVTTEKFSRQIVFNSVDDQEKAAQITKDIIDSL